MSLLKNMSAMKVMIILCVVAAGVLGWFGWEQHKRVDHLRKYLGVNAQDELVAPKAEVELDAELLQIAASNFTALTKELEGDDLRGDSSPQSYIRKIATNGKIALGGVDIDPRDSEARGYTDSTYAIKPRPLSSNSRVAPSFQRTQLANFMFKLEEGSKRVRVTNFRIQASDKALKPETIPQDRWTFTGTVTIRNKSTR